MDDPKEKLEVMIEDLRRRREGLLNHKDASPKICLIHSPYRLLDEDIKDLLKNFDILISGHMHEGMMPPILDDLIPGTSGLISPLFRPFPINFRGTVHLGNQRHLIILGGITKISESAPKFMH